MRLMVSHTKNNNPIFKPQITSLIDVMTILLVFLMKSFSVEGNIITASNDCTLPLSSSKERPSLVTTLEITENAVLAEGEVIINHKTYRDRDSLFIPEIAHWFAERSSIENKKIMLQADRKLPFSLLKRIMYTCNRAGRQEFTILVQQEE